jgi:hypothetical protein
MPEVKNDMWEVPWELETPSQGGRILAKDARSTIIYEPNCSPYNSDEIKLARLFLHSREMLEMLKRASIIIEDHRPQGNTWKEINALIAKVEG